ncbi:DNA polymerase iota isoform X3 [Suricata suricatta]|uniref:DNA polymerase iota isoform X3 n=1 Tax=Suricata suricatta TaxID=37032 RepID=UPI00115652C8|nr:DNA polymerase iota isoform X3 [Suricata suricatta]
MEKPAAEPEEEAGCDKEEDAAKAMERAEAGEAGRPPGAPEPEEPGGLPCSPEGGSSSRVIVHVDLDCFYAQVEMISNPGLKDKPLGVQQKYLVVTCNYEARKLGVKKLMNVRDAKEKCPQLVLVNGEDLTRYREMSYKVTELLEEFSPVVERLGFDENFVDLTEMVEKRLQQLQSDDLSALTVSGHVYNDQSVNLHDILHIRLLVGSQIAAEMREAMCNHLGLTGCAGVASNKLLAKLVSGAFKPNQQTVLLPESSQVLIQSLNHVKEIPGIGYKTTKRLEALGIRSVHDLQTFPSKILEKEFGILVARRIQKLSFGEDHSPVTPSGPPQSFSEEDSFKKCSSEVEVKNKIEELLASLLNRVCQDGRKPHTVRLAIRRYSSENHWGRESRQCPIPSHVIQKLGTGNRDVMTPMVDILMKLFQNMVNVKMPFHLTLLSVCLCNLKALNTAKKGTIDYYLTPSLSATSRSGKCSFKMKHSNMEDSSKDKEANWDFLPSGRIESTRTGEAPIDTTNFSKEKDTDKFRLWSLTEDLKSEQLFSTNRTTDSHKEPIATVSHDKGLTENREQDSTDEKITFPSDIDPEVFYELPEEVQKELLAHWKRTGSDFHTVQK